MNINVDNLRKQLHAFDFRKLFITELGWDKANIAITVPVDRQDYFLQAVAQKRGMVVFHYPTPADQVFPDYATRRKIDAWVRRSFHEHLIIFTDPANKQQKWQWVRREPGKPSAGREIGFGAGQSGEALLQRLKTLAFGLEEEEGLTILDVTSRVRAGFDLERVTKRFYDRFKNEHTAFLKFLKGIPDENMQRWYVSVMLNRLMFVYFIQWKGFLDGDQHYLRNRLEHTRQQLGEDRFYRDFLCPLFFAGFAKKERTPQTRALLGNVPYLNGGIFQRHQLEERFGKAIQIPDAAFTGLFDFFDGYNWHLDERPLRDDREINPDVLGFIFEKYINQKQMGAYYTKEDITGYISKYTIIPALLELTRKDCRIAFEGERAVWKYLSSDPDRYIYPAMLKGIDLPLPENILVGINDVAQRGDWNRPADEAHALPTEIWREAVARRQRAEEVRARLAAGEVRDINDLITYNLDIQQFAQDMIEESDGPELVRSFWKALVDIKVLDPTCGSGAFLFAALNILEPLYEACLDRMQSFVDDLDMAVAQGEKIRPEKYSDFRRILDLVARHPNRSYFIFKSIIVHNLYGVDIMEEAVEICKLRLFLKLIAQVEQAQDIEPLPDIDFNVRAGNTLIGFTNREEIRRALTSQGEQATLGLFGESEAAERVEEQAELADKAFQRFRQMQTDEEMDPAVFAGAKVELRKRLNDLNDVLNRSLALRYLSGLFEEDAYRKWLDSYRPFHWFVDFYGIMNSGGFDVVIGNPPYLEFSQIEYKLDFYETSESSAVHAVCVERSIQLAKREANSSMIVPLALVSTQRMLSVQRILEGEKRSVWYSNYSWRPGKLFDFVNRALTIFITAPSQNPATFSTNYQKWTSESRNQVMQKIVYIEVNRNREFVWVPKMGHEIDIKILRKLLYIKNKLVHFSNKSGFKVYYRTTGGLYWKIFTNFSPTFIVNGVSGHSSRETNFGLAKQSFVFPVIAILSSNIFWWWYTISSNLRDLNPYDLMNFPIPETVFDDCTLSELGSRLITDMKRNSEMLVRVQKRTGRTETQSFKVQKSKPIIDEIDCQLALHFGISDKEIDYISNYDVKFRLGIGGADEGD